MKSPLGNFIFGSVVGAAMATIVVLHIVTNQVQARNAQVIAALDAKAQEIQRNADQTDREIQNTAALAQQVLAAWEKRAETCEAKFSIATVVYEQQPIASVPLLRGAVSVQLAPGAGNAKPALVIPAQVDVYSLRPDLQYQWLDGHTGEPKSILYPAKTSAQ